MTPRRRPGATGAAGGLAPSWPAPASWGAGLVAAAVGAAAATGVPDATLGARGVGVALVLLGVAAIAWGAALLVRGRVPLPRTATASALVGVLLLATLLLLEPIRTSVYAVALGGALLVATALGITRATRRSRTTAPLRMPVLLAAAALLAVTVTPALGATQDAVLRQDDGSVVSVPAHEGH
ncbi:hypothetical protein P0L94_01025 [Microbacter sp. GSS18]|nr:hypothetical protein P0L94_01025 [Microbacter sp. GSS18]